MKEEEILEKVRNYVKKILQEEATGHDWYHLQRVEQNAQKINKEEQADCFFISMIAFLHDLYDHKFYQGKAEEKLEETLKGLAVWEEIPPEKRNNIIHSCTNLGFSSNFSIKKELSKEGEIVQDADRLDALGAIGIARTFAYGGKVGKKLYCPEEKERITQEEYQTTGSRTSIGHFYDKLLKLKDLMNTKEGKRLAKKRHLFIQTYLEEFLAEWEANR